MGPLLPAAGISPATDQSSGARPPLPLPIEARLSMQPFTLQQRRLIFRSAPAARSTLPAYIFVAISKSALSPFDAALPPPSDFLSPFEVRSLHVTRCQVRS